MSDNVGIGLFALTLSAALVAPKALSYLTDRRVNENTPFKRVTCISAPGKVLIAGGYLVLEHPNLGVSVSTSSRFYTTIKLQPLTDDIPVTRSCLTIVVDSPQFYTQYTYVYDPAANKVTPKGDATNPFVGKCVDLTMAFIKEFKTQDGSGLQRMLSEFSHSHYLEVVLQANNDFYSQIRELKRRKLPLLASSLLSLPKFIPCPKGKAQLFFRQASACIVI